MSFKIPCGGFRLDEESFSLDKNDVLSIPKPLTYDYMPEGYPSKSVGTVTLMEERVVEFVSHGDGSPSIGTPTNAFTPVEGQTYIVNWDGTEYECVGFNMDSDLVFGNLSIIEAGEDTGEPFLYIYGSIFTLDTSASHTISVKTTEEIVAPMAKEFLPANTKSTTVFYI